MNCKYCQSNRVIKFGKYKAVQLDQLYQPKPDEGRLLADAIAQILVAWYGDHNVDKRMVERIISKTASIAYQQGYNDAKEKVIKWGNETCPHNPHSTLYGYKNVRKRECKLCWQALKSKLEEK